MPSNLLPGWFLYIGGTTFPSAGSRTFYEVTTLIDQQTITVSPAPSNSLSGQSFFLTAGLGNAFVPPFGPWSVLRCTDCHGSTKTDPVGPHASVNRWLLKSLDTTLQFEWYNGSVTTVNPQNNLTMGTSSATQPDLTYLCFNCHRRDVYGDDITQAPTNDVQSRVPHTYFYTKDGSHVADNGLTVWPQHCRLCHGGDKLGGIHGTNITAAQGPNANEGKRFLNGSSWDGNARPTTSGGGACYTANKADPTVDSCGKGHTGTTYTGNATYDYDNP